MVNSEIGRGLYRAYRIDGQRVGLQWLYSGSTVGLQWLYNEQKTNKERRTEGEKVDLREGY